MFNATPRVIGLQRIVIGCSVMLLLASAAALAQPGPPDTSNNAGEPAGGAINEIVVTAQRREQRLQDVPISMAALNGDQLAAQNAMTFDDYAQKISSLSDQYVGPTGYRGQRNYAIRGIYGSNTVGYYIDESSVPILDPQLLDISRVEVLYGPQATLYGSNSMGGTIKIVTNQPVFNKFSGYAEAQASGTSGGGLNDGGAVVLNVPIVSDKLAARLVVGQSYDSGYIDNHYDGYPGVALNVTTPQQADHGIESDWNSARTTTARLSIRFQPIESLTITPMGYYADTELAAPDTYLAGLPLFNTIRFINTPELERVALGALNVTYAPENYEVTNILTYFKRTNKAVEDATQLQLGYVPVTPDALVSNFPYQSLVDEARMQTKFSGFVNFLVGGIVSKTHFSSIQNILDPGISAANPTMPAIPGDVIYNGYNPLVTTERDIYGEIRLTLPGNVEVIGGARHYYISTDETVASYGFIGSDTTSVTSYSESGARPRLTVSWKPAEDLNIYANYGKGFRPGGPGGPLPASCGGESPALVADTVTNYEAGAKATAFGRKLEVSGAIFRMDWTNIQQTTLLSCGYDVAANTGDARIQGAEFSFSAAPLDYFSIDGSATYTHDRITQAAAGQFAYAGDPLLFVPAWKANLGAQLQRPLATDYDGTLRIDYSYESSAWINYATSADTLPFIRGGYSGLASQATVRHGPVSYEIFGRNLTNAHPVTNYFTFATPPNNNLYSTIRPRTVGIRVSYSF
jgi:outer membrane receptor protein involved in Fe transport